jgi:hypothetical protein
VKGKKKEPEPLLVPEADRRVEHWTILGLDPSMTRTGFALLDVRPGIAHTPEGGPYTEAAWLAAGSIKPDKIEDPSLHPRNTLWIRSKAMAMYLREMLKAVAPPQPDAGLIVSMEYPTPMNDYLVALNRVIHLVFFENDELTRLFGEVRILATNASTLRSLMGLTKKGAGNKVENVRRAYDFVDRGRFPELDTDACDAVLLAMMARHVASIMLGASSEVPGNFLNSLCSARQEAKGSGRNAYTVTKGILHRSEYWYSHRRQPRTVLVKDASSPSKKLARAVFEI